LMLLSALWTLIYLQERRPIHLIISAILGGLAILTKVTALFLVPFLGLALLVDIIRNPQHAIRNTQYGIRDLFLWLLVAAGICFILWPSLWVQPETTLDLVIRQGILRKVERAHALPRFHRGELVVGDPGVAFYADVLLFRMTFLTLPLCLAASGAILTRRKERSLPILLLGVFALFYFIQMTLGGRKEDRYMLPVLLALDVLSAVGLVWWVERMRAFTSLRLRYGIPLVLAMQALFVLPHFPYFGAYYNSLLGGSRMALHIIPPADFAEGLDLVGQYVDGQPGAEGLVIGAQFLANEMLAQHVRAPVYDIAQVGNDADYLVFGVQYTMRGREYPRWGALWERTYKFREPEFVISFDGIPYAWVHRPGVDPVIPQQVNARLGESIRLAGYRLAQGEVVPGDILLLTLYWRAEALIERDYTVFVHLQGPDGQLVAQQDNPPVRGTQPTSGWEVGVLIEDPYEIPVPLDASLEDYTLSVGMYDTATVERLAAFGADGGRLPEDRVVLTTVQVQSVIPGWRWALSGAWLAVIVTGIAWPWIRRQR
jgi:hypothetical protein